MGQDEGDEWDDGYPDPMQSQPPPYSERDDHPERDDRSAPGKKKKKKETKCPTCCLKCRDCLMSAECGRALQISQVVAFCGMCIRMWM